VVSFVFSLRKISPDSIQSRVNHSFLMIRLMTARWVRHERMRRVQIVHREVDSHD
jgi:hypothetical protein